MPPVARPAADLSSRTFCTFRRELSSRVRETQPAKRDLADVPTITYASWIHDKGVPGKVVAQVMGHTNADVTINVYTQVLDASLRTAVDCIGGELFTIVHGFGNGVGAKSLI